MKLLNYIEVKVINKTTDVEQPLTETAQEFLGIEDINNGVIKHRDGYLCLDLHVTPINYGLLSDTEQNNVEDAFIELLNTIDFPIQPYIQTRYVDVSSQLQLLNEKAQNMNDGPMKRYTAELYDYYVQQIASKPILTQRYFVAIACKITKPRETINELERRANTVIEKLNECGTIVHPLNTEEIADLIYVSQNKNRSTITGISDAVKYGFKALYTAGDRGVATNV